MALSEAQRRGRTMTGKMINGYENREAMIRDHWKRYGFQWDIGRIVPWLKMAVRHNSPACTPDDQTEVPEKATIETLEFAFEQGELRGRPGYRITCEGVVVEEGYL